ncbi:hypothetical protein MHLP_03365 [Candidatus Mycoplasma haematolamae str. Purdue]|uniref:Uncharacterized protein n=1 Tax=Mycoplasma haematolamae (strain Purdue) TaxID=1212765 RepID=I7BK52_MYCHA|nr:hypothetical protein [Candidatus Mycoplasma haematolamae]AFO52253.1 hypothetical protein MHLP_03365 [Candidatus Mycoplasma haematolamae str. Purdue]
MFLTTKVQIGAALVGLGGANALAVTHFKEPIKDLFLNQDSLDLNNGSNLDNSNVSLTLKSRVRRGLESSDLSSSLDSPELALQASQPSIDLDALSEQSDHSGNFKDQVGSLRTELGVEDQIQEILETQQAKLEKAKKELEDKRTSFESAVQKIRDYFANKPDTKVRGLTQGEREALARAYKVWWDTKQAEKETRNKLEGLDKTPSRRRRSAPELKSEREVSNLLNAIAWKGNAIMFVKQELATRANNYGYDQNWELNPWREFFTNQDDWLKTWSNRDTIKEAVFKSYMIALNDDWQNGQCHPIYALPNDRRDYCLADMVNRNGSVFGEANIQIELIVGKKILDWMSYKLD